MAPARTGRDSRSKIAVIKTDHTNNGICSNFIDSGCMFKIVVIKLIAPKIEEIPAKCSEKIAISTEELAWNKPFDRGGYTVHPVPTPVLLIEDATKSVKLGGNNQKLILFIRGKAISGAFSIIGINQLPKPPIMIGITIKKIIKNAWAVTIVL